MFDQLKVILDKDPIISTFQAKDLITSPEIADKYYSQISKTHMSLGDTKTYQKRILDCLLKNKKTFNGAVVGEYGFGKTSILIYLWKYCEENNILAIPPYQWGKFHEHFQTIYHWVAYKIRKYDKKLTTELNQIFQKYKDETTENEAKKLAKEANIEYDEALKILRLQFEDGKLSIDFTPNDLLTYCEKITVFLQKDTEYQGLLVITDELQQTITDLNTRTVYDYLFNITNPLVNAQGNYGFLWGFPEKTFADLNRERSDIIDRLNSNKAFIRLSNIYDNKFALNLWESYAAEFDFQSLKNKIVDEHTLIAIGQVCDGERRDLGNGPRSVISAFNSIIYHYKTTKSKYTITNFVEECIQGEIILGGASEYVKKIKEILNIEMVGQKYEKTIKIMSGFPDGIPASTIDEYNIRQEIEELIKDSGGLGKVVIKPISNYSLRNLRKTVDNIDDSVIESVIRDFYSSYSPDNRNCEIAHNIFKKILIEEIFKKHTTGSSETWKFDNEWVECRGGTKCTLEGSFNSKYPKRKTVLFTTIKKEDSPIDPVRADLSEEHLAINFILYPFNETNYEYKISLIAKNSYMIELNLQYQEDKLNMDQIDLIIPQEKQTPLFFLALINHLKEANIPKTEIKERDYLIEKLIENIIFNSFNEDLLGYIENSEIELNNQGEYLIKELFVANCDESYPEYSTLITRGWEKKLSSYKNVLNLDSEKLSLLQKRGKETVVVSENSKENKNFIAKIFGQTSSNLESWLNDMKNLVDFKFTAQDSYFTFKIHPVEEYFLDLIEEKGYEVTIDGVKCKSIKLNRNIISNLFKKGYLTEEILNILGIGAARKYFNFDSGRSLLYKKPEDKDELRETIENFFNIVKEQVLILENFDDYTVDQDALNGLKEKIPLIENKEQSDDYSNQLKRIQSQNKHYSEKSLQNIANVDIKKNIFELDEKIKELDKTLNDIKTTTVAGQVGWVPKILQIQTNLLNEIALALSKGKTFSKNLGKLKPAAIPQNVKVISLFIETIRNYNEVQQDIKNNFLIEYENIIKKSKAFDKWKTILNKAGDVEKRFSQYSNISSVKELRDKIDELNNKVNEDLENNTKQTLNSHENYRQAFQDLQNELGKTIQNLKKGWEERKKRYEELIKEFTGNLPSSIVRWSDSPEVSYQDLYDFALQEIDHFLKKIEKAINILNDDVTYSIEVLNHQKAIQNKQIDKQLNQLKTDIDDYLNKDLSEDIKSQSYFETLSEKLMSMNECYIKINREHRSIIKPITIEDVNEKNLFTLLDKNNDLDLKRLIIDFQKKCTPEMDLTECRDEVLNLMKELFLKKQVRISIKKGK